MRFEFQSSTTKLDIVPRNNLPRQPLHIWLFRSGLSEKLMILLDHIRRFLRNSVHSG